MSPRQGKIKLTLAFEDHSSTLGSGFFLINPRKEGCFLIYMRLPINSLPDIPVPSQFQTKMSYIEIQKSVQQYRR
jgi:hypothetical protein